MEGGKPLFDAGYDISVDPYLIDPMDFVVTGSIHPNSGSMYGMYLCRVANSGVFMNGYYIRPNNVTPGFMTGTSLAPTGSVAVAVTGVHKDPSGTNRVFELDMSSVTGFVNWSKLHDPIVNPGNAHPRIIHEDLATSQGLLITSPNHATTPTDGSIIRTDLGGGVNDHCPSVNLELDIKDAGSGYYYTNQRKENYDYVSVTMPRLDIESPEEQCKQPYIPRPCDYCLNPPKHSVCCCVNPQGGLEYQVCLRFDTLACREIKYNWKINVLVNGVMQTITNTDLLCFTVPGPGVYVIQYNMEGMFFENGMWQYCISRNYYKQITVDPCGINPFTPPCTSPLCYPPLFYTKKQQTVLDHNTANSSNVRLYPNPAGSNESVILEFKTEAAADVEIQLTNIAGELIWSQSKREAAGTNQAGIPTKGLASGIYLVRFNDGKQTSVMRLVIQ